MELARATPSDAEAIAVLGRTTFAETFGYLFVGRENELEAYLDRTFGVDKLCRSLERAQNRFWVVFDDHTPIGYAKLKFPSDHAAIGRTPAAQLQKIYVLQRTIARGAGALLLDAAWRQSAAVGAKTLWLSVLSENRRAINFYEKHGFAKSGADDFTIGSQTFGFDVLSVDVCARRTRTQAKS